MIGATNAPHFNISWASSAHFTSVRLSYIKVKKVKRSLFTPQSHVGERGFFLTSAPDRSEWEVSFTPRLFYSRNSPNKRRPVLKIKLYIILPSTVKSPKGHLFTRVAFIHFNPFNNFTCIASSIKFTREVSRFRWFRPTDLPAAHRTLLNPANLMCIGPCIILINEEHNPTRCYLLLHYAYVRLNMFRAPLHPSSGAHDDSVGYHIGRLVPVLLLVGG